MNWLMLPAMTHKYSYVQLLVINHACDVGSITRLPHIDLRAKSKVVMSSTCKTCCAAVCALAARASTRPAWCTTDANCGPPYVVTPRASLGGGAWLKMCSHCPYLNMAGGARHHSRAPVRAACQLPCTPTTVATIAILEA